MTGNELPKRAGEPEHWVFGYGSLLWNPGFAFIRAEPALLRGAHRSLSIYSHDHRGTAERPGLVFGLVPGGSCRGMAYQVADADWAEVQSYLRVREQVTSVYREDYRRVRLDDGSTVRALVYVVELGHAHYAGTLDLDQQAAIVRSGIGASGRNIDYVLNTVEQLQQLGIHDQSLLALSRLLAA